MLELEIPNENDLIRSYLTNRLQVVKINNEYNNSLKKSKTKSRCATRNRLFS